MSKKISSYACCLGCAFLQQKPELKQAVEAFYHHSYGVRWVAGECVRVQSYDSSLRGMVEHSQASPSQTFNFAAEALTRHFLREKLFGSETERSCK